MEISQESGTTHWTYDVVNVNNHYSQLLSLYIIYAL